MGIVVVLIFYAVLFTIAACIGAAVLGALAAAWIRPGTPGRRTAIIAASLFPCCCVVFAGLWFGTYAVMNGLVFHRDPGLGDSWETPLPNGYALVMIDTTDQGTVYNPKDQSGDGSVSSQKDAVFGVRQLQVADALIFGAQDTGYFGRIGQNSHFVDAYFELDTNRNTVTLFKSMDALRKQAASEGVTLQLRDFNSVFGTYRNTWFDYVAGSVLFLVPLTALFLLVSWMRKVRQSGHT